MIEQRLALRNGNDLRIYYLQNKECRARELDRIVHNMGTAKATLLFKLQGEVSENSTEASSYFLLYGKENARSAKQNPENVFLFYEDFSSKKLEKWEKNWGTAQVVKGQLEVVTQTTPNGDSGEAAIFVKGGRDWKDVEVELDMMEKNSDQYPGPFLRVKDPHVKITTAWWFEYWSGKRECTMRPYMENRDGQWAYKSKLSKPLVAGTWVHAKYIVFGENFSHWVNGQLIHDNVKVLPNWVVSEGTLGLGCHTSGVGCNTFYDNIKVTNYVWPAPKLSLGSECQVDLDRFHGLGITKQNPATSCKQLHDISLHDAKHRLENGVYWIKTAADQSVQTYCDIVNGGWTLAGKISGRVGNIHKTWLVANHGVKNLFSPVLSTAEHFSCIDARYLATYHASTIMLASGENPNGIGQEWVQWSLPAKRKSKTLWTHDVGLENVSASQMNPITVKSSNGVEEVSK